MTCLGKGMLLPVRRKTEKKATQPTHCLVEPEGLEPSIVQAEIILNVPLEEFEEFKSHSLSVRTPSGRKTDLKQAPVRGLGTPNGGIVVFDKTSGEAMNIMPKSSAHVTLRCQDE